MRITELNSISDFPKLKINQMKKKYFTEVLSLDNVKAMSAIWQKLAKHILSLKKR